jgi:hypothetical protein
MKIKVANVLLHNPFFLAGKNFGNRLEQGKFAESIDYIPDHKMIVVLFNKQVGFIPESNIANWSPSEPHVALEYYTLESVTEKTVIKEPKKPKATHASHPMVAGIDRAQVSDPTRGMK